MPRMQILTASEQKAFDAPPVLSYAERDTFFQVSERLAAINCPQRTTGVNPWVNAGTETNHFR